MIEPVSVIVHPAIGGLLMGLPPPGNYWPAAEKAKFLAAIGAVLDLIYDYPAPPAEPVGCELGDVPSATGEADA